MQGTVTSAPNFGYALAARKTPPDTIGELSLKHVRILMDAAEPVCASPSVDATWTIILPCHPMCDTVKVYQRLLIKKTREKCMFGVAVTGNKW